MIPQSQTNQTKITKQLKVASISVNQQNNI